MNIREKKIVNAILFFASKSSDNKINRLKLMKLLWLSDRIHLNKHGRLILKDAYNALPHGPIPSATMDLTKRSFNDFFAVSGFNITVNKSFDSVFFSNSDIEIMEEVWIQYGGLSRYKLRDLSHKFPEWLRYEDDLKDQNSPNSYGMLIEDFFNAPLDNDIYIHDDELSKKSKSVFNSHKSLQSFLSE